MCNGNFVKFMVINYGIDTQQNKEPLQIKSLLSESGIYSCLRKILISRALKTLR